MARLEPGSHVRGIMSKLLVTGATGALGRKTIIALSRQRPATDLVALARDREKAADLAGLGIEVREADYLDRASLSRALRGIDKVMLTSAQAFTDRNTAHANVIDAAVDAGVRHLVFMPVIRKRGSSFTMEQVTAEDIVTVDRLKASGLGWTLARHPPFLDGLDVYIGKHALERGVRVPAGDGRVAAATRDDLAAAHAAILASEGHERRTYDLTGDPAVSFAEIAATLSEAHGRHVPYVPISERAYFEQQKQDLGLPDHIVAFLCQWVQGMTSGEWEDQTTDLAALIGRKPTSATEYFASGAPAAGTPGS